MKKEGSTEGKNKRQKTTYRCRYNGDLLAVTVHAANLHDTKSGITVAQKACEKYPSIKGFCADAGYRGTFVSEVKSELHRSVDISEKIKPHEWENEPLPVKWTMK